MKKNIIRIALASIAFIASLTVYNYFTRQGNEGSKEVQIIIQVEQADQDLIVLDVTKRTDDEMLGTFLETVLEEEGLDVEFAGNATDQFGRYIVGISEYVTKDTTVGPWWLFNSPTNPDCVSAGFCPGVDITPLYDKDVFIFDFTSSY